MLEQVQASDIEWSFPGVNIKSNNVPLDYNLFFPVRTSKRGKLKNKILDATGHSIHVCIVRVACVIENINLP